MVFFEKRGHRLKTYLAPTIIISSLEYSLFYIFLFLFLQLIDSWSMIAHTPITNPTELWKRTCHRVSIKLSWNFALFQWEVVHERRTNRIDSSIDPRGHTRICERDEQQVSPKNHSGNACFLLHATKQHKIVKESGAKQRTIIGRMPAFRTSNHDDRTFLSISDGHTESHRSSMSEQLAIGSHAKRIYLVPVRRDLSSGNTFSSGKPLTTLKDNETPAAV